jgi:hypothetical protein
MQQRGSLVVPCRMCNRSTIATGLVSDDCCGVGRHFHPDDESESVCSWCREIVYWDREPDCLSAGDARTSATA